MIEALKEQGIHGSTVLDIGGGIGAIQHELLGSGAARAVSVEASSAYVRASREEAERRGMADRIEFHHGDFVELASNLHRADIVTLDRVICCYHDMKSLVGRSAALASELFAAVFPRDTWWVKLYFGIGNLWFRVSRNPFRVFVHPSREIEAQLHKHGLKQQYQTRTFVWQIVVYGR